MITDPCILLRGYKLLSCILSCIILVTLNWTILSLRDIWQYLGTFLLLQLRVGFVPGLWWVEGNDAVNDPMVNRTAPQQRLIWSKMSVVPLLRNPILFLTFSGLP